MDCILYYLFVLIHVFKLRMVFYSMAEPFQFPGQEEQKPHKKKGFSLFKKKEEPHEEQFPAPNIMNSVNALDARLKILEGRLMTILDCFSPSYLQNCIYDISRNQLVPSEHLILS